MTYLFINSWTSLLFIFVVKCLFLFSKCSILKLAKNEYCVFRKLIDWIFFLKILIMSKADDQAQMLVS